MDKSNKIMNQRIEEILGKLEDSFSLSIQGSIQSMKNHKEEIITALECLKIKHKEEEQDSPWGYGVNAVKVDNITKENFLKIKYLLLKESSQGYLELELLFSDSKQKIWLTHDSDVKHI